MFILFSNLNNSTEHMKGKTILIYLLLFIAITFATYIVTVNSETTKVAAQDNKLVDIQINETADRLEVYYFHRTQRCSTCLAIGRYTKEIIQEKFSDQASEGMIDFREINIDLVENAEIVSKYRATGQSLYINAVKDGKDNINQDIKIWRLVRSEGQFKDYLASRINSLLTE